MRRAEFVPRLVRAPLERTTPRRTKVLLAVAMGVILAATVLVQLEHRSAEPSSLRVPSAERAQRVFSADSWWNTPLPDATPLHPRSESILDYLSTGPDSRDGCLMLGGAGENTWGTPIYWALPSDPEYDVRSTVHPLPPELAELRIPRGARPAANNDSEMTVYDRGKGYVVALTHAEYDAAADRWSASGATISYLDSNGLHAKTDRSDDPRNTGTHRGNNGPTMAVSWDQVQSGAIRHVLKIASGPETADRHVFPMVGSDGEYQGQDRAVPPQGLRLRIKADVDLESLDLDPEAVVIARALQRYGVYIGDSGGSTALKLEDTRSEGRGQLWTLDPTAMCALPFDARYWAVVDPSYDPTRSKVADR